MPEYPEVVVYVERLGHFVVGEVLQGVRVTHPFLLRTVDPPLDALAGRAVTSAARMGKRIILGFDPVGEGAANELFLVMHLMITGRLTWRKRGVSIRSKRDLAALDFAGGSLVLSEYGSQKRASFHVVRGRDALDDFDPGGLEVLEAGVDAFAAAVREENHTLKRTLTDPTILSGIGNAYSDEILHRAGLSPFLLSQNLDGDQIARLYAATRAVLTEFAARIREEVGDDFPGKLTAFRDDMAVHGRYGEPCPACGTEVQRIRYAANETNYCPRCQTEGRLLADRALSRLLKEDWPRTVEELESRRRESE
jgi:formamidopyrimidine-DNA glycosylase